MTIFWNLLIMSTRYYNLYIKDIQKKSLIVNIYFLKVSQELSCLRIESHNSLDVLLAKLYKSCYHDWIAKYFKFKALNFWYIVDQHFYSQSNLDLMKYVLFLNIFSSRQVGENIAKSKYANEECSFVCPFRLLL